MLGRVCSWDAAHRGGSVRVSSGDSWVVRGRSEPEARVGVLGVGGVAVGMGGRWLRVAVVHVVDGVG